VHIQLTANQQPDRRREPGISLHHLPFIEIIDK
jgi:hypothetical protein